MEIERQFLVTALPPLPADFENIRQGYVALEPEIRIRQIGNAQFVLTVKRGSGLVREEWETAVSRREFESLAKRLEPGTKLIEKRRYRIPLADGHIAELHIHDGHLSDFAYVEVEFPSAEEAASFAPPDWFGREVTEDSRFSYSVLTRADGIKQVQKILEESPMNTPELSIPFERCNKQGKIFAIANRLGYDLEGYVERYMTSELATSGRDDDYAYYQIASPSYSLDLIEDEELLTEKPAEGKYSNGEAYWAGFFYKYLGLALSLRGEALLEKFPFVKMHEFYLAFSDLPKETVGRKLLELLRAEQV
ncbi:MAG: CYTH domain-containing protein [Schwartzia sp.]|nr:CYTH domain-containing protein [Schwartzia sp. (in: firmicutes)]